MSSGVLRKARIHAMQGRRGSGAQVFAEPAGRSVHPSPFLVAIEACSSAHNWGWRCSWFQLVREAA